MLNQKFLLAAVLAACLLAPGMFAGTVTQTCTPSIATTQSIGYTLDCTISAFNTSLGTLTGVTLQLTGVGGDVIPTQYNASGTQVAFNNSLTTISMAYEELGSTTALVQVEQASSACGGEAQPGANNWCTPAYFSALSSAVMSDANLSYYETGSTVTLAGVGGAVNSSGSTLSSQIYFGGAGTIGGVLTVTYTYGSSSVPEPTTMALLGAGMIGLAAIVRKRRA
jgi:hypothetical protein